MCVRVRACIFLCIVLRITNYQSRGVLTCCDMVDLLAVALMNA